MNSKPARNRNNRDQCDRVTVDPHVLEEAGVEQQERREDPKQEAERPSPPNN